MLRRVRVSMVAIVASVAALTSGVTPAGAAPAAPTTAARVATEAGMYVPLTPARLLDTRSGLGAPRAAVAPLGTLDVQVTGRGGVPAGASAVLLNVTVTNPTGSGYVTVYPAGVTRPTASNLNFVAKQTVPNAVAARLGTDGRVALYNGSGGTADLLADVAGYYVGGAAGADGAFADLSPTRVLDTRSDLGGARGPVAPGGTISLQTTGGTSGVPADASAVLLNVTVTNATGSGYVTAYPEGQVRPVASSLNFAARQTVANLVAVRVGEDGVVDLYNGSGGTIDLLADVAGYFLGGDQVFEGGFRSLSPARVLDTRSGTGAPVGALAPGGTAQLQVTGRGGVPASGVSAVLLNVTVVKPSGGGYLTAYPDGASRPTASNLNFVPGATLANLVAARVGAGGRVAIYNGSGGTTHVLADVAGYVLAAPATPPDTTAPGPVTAVRTTATTASSVTLAWTNPTDGDFTGVTIRRVTGTQTPPTPGAGAAVAETAATGVTDTGLAAGTTYTYGLFAHDAVPNYAARASITVTTAPAPIGPTGAVVDLGTVDWSKDSVYDNWNWATPDLVRLTPDAAGRLAVITYHPSSVSLTVQSFDPTTRAQVGSTRTVALAGWPVWGGVYAAPGGDFYVAVGRENPNEDDALDVVAIRRYDANWALLGTAYVKGGASQGIKGIFSPFDAGAPHMVLVGGKLVLHMSRLMYAIDGVHHQGNMTIEVDVASMTATPFSALGGYAYSSHSFQQLVTTNGTNLVTIDHGDAYPRAVQLGVTANYPSSHQTSAYDLFEFNGGIGDNFTGASVTGLVSGPAGVVVVGNSIRQPNAPGGQQGSSTENRNVYAIAAVPSTGAHTVRWLSTVTPTGSEKAFEPRVVQVGGDRFAVLFTVTNGSAVRTEYRLLDSTGAVRASATFTGLRFAAGTDPVQLGSRVYWAGRGATGSTGYVFGLDVSDPTRPVLLG